MLPAATVISSGGTWRYGDKDLGAIETLSREISCLLHTLGRVRFLHSAPTAEMTACREYQCGSCISLQPLLGMKKEAGKK